VLARHQDDQVLLFNDFFDTNCDYQTCFVHFAWNLCSRASGDKTGQIIASFVDSSANQPDQQSHFSAATQTYLDVPR
jgi:glycosyltransferase A (GT-A) superfamily protein (DUF2064 family)